MTDDASFAKIDAQMEELRRCQAEIAEQTARRDAAKAQLAALKAQRKADRQAFRDACARRK